MVLKYRQPSEEAMKSDQGIREDFSEEVTSEQSLGG